MGDQLQLIGLKEVGLNRHKGLNKYKGNVVTDLLTYAKKVLSLIIIIVGVAMVVRSVLVAGPFNITAGLVAGLAFIIYGAVRLHYTRGAA